ncbi:hypothetical protein B296_00053882 [Ensete ventricosum]|uniref:Uncharacterized protein n=1 Tax=Ensete ventricosum TaxID=4639 RepID=A0A426XA00_ENSVE|nr:hypothetical protein B296_00053882 [Ensete ventricosum]
MYVYIELLDHRLMQDMETAAAADDLERESQRKSGGRNLPGRVLYDRLRYRVELESRQVGFSVRVNCPDEGDLTHLATPDEVGPDPTLVLLNSANDLSEVVLFPRNHLSSRIKPQPQRCTYVSELKVNHDQSMILQQAPSCVGIAALHSLHDVMAEAGLQPYVAGWAIQNLISSPPPLAPPPRPRTTDFPPLIFPFL